MALTPQDVSRIAHLARLELSGAEQASLLTQLNGFFSIVEQMGAVDTTGVEPLYTPLSAVQEVSLRLRDDAVTESDRRAFNQRFLDEVDPERRLPERERLRRADAARRAYFTRLAYLSARKRRGAGR